MNSTKRRIGIVCPCPKEYRACAEVLGLSAEERIAGRRFSCRKGERLEVFAVQAGTGKINCASAAQLIIDSLHPSLIIDAGSAGGLTDRLAVQDIVCVRRSFEYDVVPLNDFSSYAGELTSSTLVHEFDEETRVLFREHAVSILRTTRTRLVIGDVACGEKNVNNAITRKQLSQMFGAVACTWETSAILRPAQLNGLPSLGFRVITDNADEGMAQDFQANIDKALRSLFTFVERVLFDGWLIQVLESLETMIDEA